MQEKRRRWALQFFRYLRETRCGQNCPPPPPTRRLINFRSWSQLMWLGDLMLDNLALLFQTVSGLRVDLVAKFGGGTCYCFCFYLYIKIQQRPDDSPPPPHPIHCAGQQLYSRHASAEWPDAWSPARQRNSPSRAAVNAGP